MTARVALCLAVALSLALIFGGLALAAEIQGKVAFSGSGGYSWLNPVSFNIALQKIEEKFESWSYFGSDTGTIRPLQHGIRYAAEIRYGLTNNLLIGAGYTQMSGSGQVNWDTGVCLHGEWKATLVLRGVTGSLLFLGGKGDSHFYLGGGAGWYSGTITRVAYDTHPGFDFDGRIVYQAESTFGFHGIVGIEYFLSQDIALNLEGMFNSITLPGQWIIKEYPERSRIGEVSSEWTEQIQTGGITFDAGIRFYLF